MSSNGSGRKLEGFFTGKGFYIVLFLCAAVIGVSAWMMAAGDVAMKKDAPVRNNVSMGSKRVETVIVPAETLPPAPSVPVFSPSEEDIIESAPVFDEAPEISAEGINETVSDEDFEAVEVWREGDVMEVAAPMYVWPLSGELERMYSVDELSYDVTMRDWRTHAGLDIMAPLGSTVVAAREGSVESITADPLFGTVVTIDHGDGVKTIYANLADVPAVNVGDWVAAGAVIGSVGTTAICEIGQGTHLHFAISVSGVPVDPIGYLPA